MESNPPNPTATGHESPIASMDFQQLRRKQDLPRRRILRACDMCRKKKIKCDGKLPACTNCENYHTKCVFTFVEKKRSPPKGAKYIEGLENRLERMESLLKLSGILPNDGNMDLGAIEKELSSKRRRSLAPTDQMKDRNSSISESLYETPESSSSVATTPEAEKQEGVEALSDMMCSLVTNSSGETRFIGSSSGFSIFSPRGIQWVNSKTGDHSFQKMLSNAARGDDKWSHWRSDVFDPLFSVKYSMNNPLPSKEEARQYMCDFFQSFNMMFPLFQQQKIEELFEQHYSNSSAAQVRDSSGWYSSINMILAIGCRVRGAQNPNAEEEAKGWAYFQNAASVLTELTLKNTDLLSIQAMLAMALFLQGTANPQPSYFLVAAAVRVANSIGMHRRSSSFGFSESERQQRLRCFWIAYLLDKDITLRSGRPPSINDDDINVELPEEDPSDGLGTIELAGGRGKVNIFRLMCTFSQISSRVYMQIYSASAARKTDGELLSTIAKLDDELENWRDSIPIDFRPEHEISDEYKNALGVIVLHFAYYNCLTTIHRMSVQQGYWTSRLSNYAISGAIRPMNARIYSSASLCVSAARASVHLIKYISGRDNPCAWMVLYYPVSALVTLFANILQNPQDNKATSDLALMGVVVEWLQSLKQGGNESDSEGVKDEGNVSKLLYIAAEFDRIARLVLEKSHREASARRKRRHEESLSSHVKSQTAEAESQPNMNDPKSSSLFQHSSETAEAATETQSNLPRESADTDEVIDHQNYSPGVAMEYSGAMDNQLPTFSPEQMDLETLQQPLIPPSLWNLEWDWTELGLGVQGHPYQAGL